MPRIHELLSSTLDWRYIIGRAVHHRVVPIFFQNLRALSASAESNKIPDAPLKLAKNLSYAFVGHNIATFEEASRLYRCMASKEIRFMPIKGVLLGETVFPESNLRFIRDIDLLFPDNSAMRMAEKVLVGLGYRLVWTDSRASAFRLSRGRDSFNVDLHRSFSFFHFHEYPRTQDLVEDMWRHSSRRAIAGVQVQVMSPECMLTLLALHSFFHGFLSILDLSDAVHIVGKYPSLDWNFILNKVKRYRCMMEIPLKAIDSACNNFLGIKIVPSNIEKASQEDNSHITGFKEEVAKRFLLNCRYFISYKEFCHDCSRECVYFSRTGEPETSTYGRMKEYLYEYYYIISLVRRHYGYRYSLRCLAQELMAPSAYCLGRSIGSLGPMASSLAIQELLWQKH